MDKENIVEQVPLSTKDIIDSKIREVYSFIGESDEGLQKFIGFEITDESSSLKDSKLYTRKQKKEMSPYIAITETRFPHNSSKELERYRKENKDKKTFRSRMERFAKTKAFVSIETDGNFDLDEIEFQAVNMEHRTYGNDIYKNTEEELGITERALQVKTRFNKDGNIDVLYYRQIKELPNYNIVDTFPKLLQKNLMINALPNHLQREGFTENAEKLRISLQESKDLDNDSFLEKFEEEVRSLPYKEILNGFVEKLEEDYTSIPEYVQSVADTLNESGYYEAYTDTLEL
jgi:hypothetical protein